MSDEAKDEDGPKVEVYLKSKTGSFAQANIDTPLAPEEVAALQKKIASILEGFKPPMPQKDESGYDLQSFEICVAFDLQVGSGKVLQLVFDGSGSASVSATLRWAQN